MSKVLKQVDLDPPDYEAYASEVTDILVTRRPPSDDIPAFVFDHLNILVSSAQWDEPPRVCCDRMEAEEVAREEARGNDL